jgi:hypothetical protein
MGLSIFSFFVLEEIKNYLTIDYLNNISEKKILLAIQGNVGTYVNITHR